MPVINLEGFQLDELDSYSSPVQVKQETNPKPTDTSKPTSSKTATAPKPSTASKSRGPSSCKRKEPDSPVTSDGLERLVFLYEDVCGLNKMLESKLKKVEATVADQAANAATKSQHYEDKYKVMIQEHRDALQKVAQEAHAKYDAAQVQHEQGMASYREGLKGSVVISLLQARLKMAYEARAMGLKCPSWNVETWEAKLRDLGGNRVEHPAKPVVEEPSKGAEKVTDVGGNTKKDAGAYPRPGAGADAYEAMVEEGTTP
ncbi:hypothetical protein Hanom_Chr13g01203341 [Helianthus anomalus]